MFRSTLPQIYRTASVAAATVTQKAVAPATFQGASTFARRFYSDKSSEESKKESKVEEDKKAEDAVSIEEFSKLKKQIEEKDAKIKELKDAYLRSLAETENIRTRSQGEIAQSKDFAIQKFAKDLLDTVDILELALKHVPKEHISDKTNHKSLADLFEGVDMTRDNLLKTLDRHGVKTFDPMDEPYDPNTSHALYQAPMPGKTPGTVFSIEKRGYMIKGRVLRPAQVGVVLDPNGN